MLEPYRGGKTYTAGISATSLHDGGANPCYLTPSGSLKGGQKISLGQADASARDAHAVRRDLQAHMATLPDQGLYPPGEHPHEKRIRAAGVRKDNRTPGLTEEDLENAGVVAVAPPQSSPWILIALGTFIMMMTSGR